MIHLVINLFEIEDSKCSIKADVWKGANYPAI